MGKGDRLLLIRVEQPVPTGTGVELAAGFGHGDLSLFAVSLWRVECIQTLLH